MLKPENRLRATEDFDRVRREGKRWRSDLLSLSVFAHHNGPSRFGFVVGKAVVSKATARNRLKRVMRAAVRMLLAGLPPGYDVVIAARPAAAGADYHALASAIERMLAQAGMPVAQIEGDG